MEKAILSVTNDLSYDQRVHKVALTLQSIGYDVLLVGRKRKKSENLSSRSYGLKRLNLFFEKGPFFYLEYNIRLFLFLLINKSSVLVANDLDTLLANYCASLFKKSKLVYDSHELFTEVPELQNRPKIKAVWQKLENFLLPKIKYCYTVSESVANFYNTKYKSSFQVVRNLPHKLNGDLKKIAKPDKKIVLYQGSVNKGRGVDLMIRALEHLNNVEFWVVGEGDELQRMINLTDEINVHDNVKFYGGILFEDLAAISSKAHLGISFENIESLNYKYALPNKVFDYIQMNIPVLASPIIEVEELIHQYEIGCVINKLSPEAIAEKINEIFANHIQYDIWKQNTQIAANELCWENEQEKLKRFYGEIT